MTKETTATINENAIAALRSRVKGALLQPGEAQYKEASTAWNLQAQQRPALVLVAAGVEDIIAAVQFAGDTGMGVGVMATGHGVGMPCDGGLLINTSGLRGVQVDPGAQTAKVEAGALWKDVVPAAHAHGLAGLVGSAPHVGVIGYTLGGGFGYLGRKYGLNANSVIGADIVTADGKLVHVSADENAELFRGLKNSGGNFGIVVSLEFRLYPLTKVYGGAVFYPADNAREALSRFARWAADLPDEVTAAFTLMNYPPLPFLPEPLRGRSVVVIKGCYCGTDPEAGADMFRAVRTGPGPAIMDTFGTISVTEMDAICKDPVDPIATLQYGALLSDLSDEAIDVFVKQAGAVPGSLLFFVELRRLGGALQRDPGQVQFMGSRNARFLMNAMGATATPEMFAGVSEQLALITEATRPFQTGETFLNFVEVSPTVERVRSAYTAEDWERLLALKKRYDPTNIFRFNRNIPPQ